MLTKSILAGAAIALAATIGSASAADQFTTIAGFEAQTITKQEMGVARGSGALLFVSIVDINPLVATLNSITGLAIAGGENSSPGMERASTATGFQTVAVLVGVVSGD